MKKWKKVALALTAAMMFTTVVGVTACKKGGNDNPSGPGGETPGGPVAPGPGPGTPVDTKVELRDDTRADAYIAYKPDGSELGKFKSLAAAINAAVEFDAEEEQPGSYVRKAGGTHNLFKNRAGYEGTGDGNDDTFWFYEEGTKLAMVDCWQNDQVAGVLQNSDYVVSKISHFGTDSVQSWNGYRVLSADGDPMDVDEKFAQSWELSSTMDVSMMAFPKRLNGVTKQTYKLDLSDVQITPPYKGADDTYAFMGFYNWQDFYVIDIGIACDTATGVWYPLIATSRDDSFSDAEYKFDETAIMRSTYNEEGYYFKPDITGLTMSIETQRLEDPRDGALYQSNYFTITNTATGELLYEYRIEEETTQEYFSTSIGMENTYVFNAGLDIKSELGFDNTHVKAVDYFNGAAFENLKITSAEWYFPKEEEVPNDVYGPEIDDDLRGKTFNVILANADKELPSTGVYDYVLLNNSYFVDYSQINGADVYSFSFKKSAVSDEEFAGDLAGYQSAIDELIGVTEETVVSFADKITEMNKWDAVTIEAKYYQLLDFAPLRAASELLTAVMTISDDAKAVKADFLALENIDKYVIKGWEAPAGAAIKGYIWSEIQKFEEIQAAYGDLGEEDQNNLRFHIDMVKFEKWSTLAEEMTAAVDALEEDTTKVKLADALGTLANNYEDRDAIEVLTQLVYWANAVKTWEHYPEGVSPDGDKLYGEGTPVPIYIMDTNANWYASVRIVYCYQILKARLDDAGVEVPTWIEDILDDIRYDDFYEGVYYPLYGTVLAGLKVSNNKWQNDDELEDFLNDVWGPDYTIATEITWNWNNGNRFRTYLTSRTSYLIRIVLLQNPELSNASFTTKKNVDGVWVADPTSSYYIIYDYYEVVGNMLKDVFGFTLHNNEWGITQGTIDLEVNTSEAAQAVIDAINALPLLNEAYTVIGWTAPEEAPAEGEAPAGYYYYDNILAARAAKAAFDALTDAADLVAVNSYINVKNYNAWVAEAAALKLIEDNSAYETATFKVPNKVRDGGTDEEPNYKEDNANVATFIPGVYSEKDAEYALTYLLVQATTTRTTEQGVLTTYSSNNNRSARIALFYEFLTEELEATLTPYMQSLLSAIKFDDWYEQVWTPITGLMDIEQKVTGDEAYTSMTDFSEAELKFLNDYYTTSFTMGDLLKKYYVTGATAESGEPAYGAAMVEGSFGHKIRLMMQSYAWSQEYPIPAGTARALLDTLENINTFLQSKGYPIAGNKWGVASAKILGEDLDETVGGVVALITPVGNIADVDYNAKGWEAPADESITGYIYSEYLAYKGFKVAYAALTDAQKEKADIFVNAAVVASWDIFASELETLMADAAWENFTFSYASHNKMGEINGDFGYQYFSGTTLAENQANGLALVNLMKWTKSISTNHYWTSSNHLGNPTDSVSVPFTDMYWIYRQLDKAGLATKLPTAVKSQYNAVVSHFGNGAKYIQDLEYLFTATEIMIKIEDKTATVAEIVNLVNTYMVNKIEWNDGGMGWGYKAPGSYPRVDQALQKYYKLADTTTVTTPINAILAVIPDVPTVANKKGDGFTPIGVSRQITAADVTYTADPGYATTQSGTLLPQFNKNWTVQSEGESVTTVASDSEGYKITASEAVGGAYYVWTALNKSVAIKGNALHYNFSFTEGEGLKYDFLIWYKVDGQTNPTGNANSYPVGADYYVYFSDKIAGSSVHNGACMTGAKSGSFNLSDIITQEGTNITITAIGVRMWSAGTFTISELYVDSLPGYKAPQEGNLLPDYTAEFTKEELSGTTASSVVETANGYKFTSTDGDTRFTYDCADIANVKIADKAIYYDVTGGTNDSLIVWVRSAAGTDDGYFYPKALDTAGNGYVLLTDALTYLVARTTGTTMGSQKTAWGFSAEDTELTITKIRIDAYNSADDLTVSAFYLGNNPGYVATQDRNLLPSLNSDWAPAEAGGITGAVTSDSEGYKFSATADEQFYYNFEDLTVSVNDSLFFNVKVAAGTNYTIYVYARSATGTDDGYFGVGSVNALPNTAGNGYITMKTALDYLVARTTSTTQGSQKPAWGFNGNEETFTITQIRIDVYGGTTELAISALYFDTTPIEAIYGNAGTSAMTGITTDWFKTSYASGETRTYALNQENSTLSVAGSKATVANTGSVIVNGEAQIPYSYSLPVGITIKRDTVLYYDLSTTWATESDSSADLVIWISNSNYYFNLSEVITWLASGKTSKTANALKGDMKGAVTGADLIDFLVWRGRSGWGFTAEAAPGITEIGVYEVVYYLKNATLTINDLRVIGEYSTTKAVSYSKDSPTVFQDWYVSPAKLEKGTSLTIKGSQTRNDTETNWFSMDFEIRETGKGFTCRSDNYCWIFGDSTLVPNGGRDTANTNLTAYFGDGEHETGADGAAVADWANYRAIANNCDWTLTVTWTGDTVTAVITLTGKDTAVEGYTATSTYTFNAAATGVALEIAVTGDTVTNLSVNSVTKTFKSNN